MITNAEVKGLCSVELSSTVYIIMEMLSEQATNAGMA